MAAIEKPHTARRINLIIISVLLILLISWKVVDHITLLLEQENVGIMTEVTKKSAQIAGERLAASVHEIEAQSRVAGVMLQNGSAFEHVLQTLTYAHREEMASLALIDADGRAVDEQGAVTDVHGDPNFLRSLQTGQTTVSAPLYDHLSGSWIIKIYAPEFLPASEQTVTLCAAMPLENLYRDLELSFFEGQGQSFITASSGQILVGAGYTAADDILNNVYYMLQRSQVGDKEIAVIRQDCAALNSGVRMLALSGEPMLVCYFPLKHDTDWYFMSVIPESAIMQSTHAVVRLTLALCVIVALLILLGILLLQRQAKRQHLHLQELAYEDTLTGLPNRYYIEEMVMHDLEEEHAHAGVILDIDKFKMINEALGRQTGDEILRSVAAVLRRAMGPGENCARMGGDQFFMILHYQDRRQLEERLHLLFDAIRQEIVQRVDGDSIINFSCGVRDIIEESQDLATVFDQADIARKQVKALNGDVVCFFDHTMLALLQAEKAIEDRMEKALAAGEFVPWFQPKVDMQTGLVHGAEALVRWMSEDLGVVTPDRFIPLFEKNGFITRVDFAMLERVCHLKQAWKQKGLANFVISVNMSRHHLLNRNFVANLTRIIAQTGISPREIEIEITESAFFYDTDLLLATLRELKAAGLLLSMDDFGSGYSSLNLLKSIPLDVLKMDKEFLVEDAATQRGRTIILSMLRMAKEIGVEVICEGVETRSQAEFLLQSGCRYAQGYLFARPMPAAEFEEYMAQHCDGRC